MGYERECQSCGSTRLVRILDLGRQPICNKFLRSGELKREKFYPLELMLCTSCQLMQLSYVPPSREVFDEHYNYLGSSTPERVDYFTKLGREFEAKFDLGREDYVVDIGSNDGVFLKPLLERGVKVLGVEPAPEPCKVAIRRGVPTINRRFEDAVGKVISTTKGHVKLITAFNVLAHTDTIHKFLNGVKRILQRNPAAVFISRSEYLRNIIFAYEYDTVYHEHARYYSLTSLEALFRLHGLKIYDASISKAYDESIMVYADLGSHKESKNVAIMRKKESRTLSRKSYAEFARIVIENRNRLRELISGFNKEGKEVVGIGAPMRSSTLLNYCGLGPNEVRYLTEVNPLKVGTFSPGMHIPVVGEARLLADQPQVALILTSNAAARIIKTLRSRGYRGKFIVHLPYPHIVG